MLLHFVFLGILSHGLKTASAQIDCMVMTTGECSRSCGIGVRSKTSVCGPEYHSDTERCCVRPCLGGAPVSIQVTCDNDLEVFVDGISNISSNDWEQTSTADIGTTPVVVAINCVALHTVGGILATFSNGDVTNSDWKCTGGHEDGWFKPDFDDTDWPYAQEIEQHPSRHWGDIDGISGTPYWIWTNNGSDKNVYCRKTIKSGHIGPGDSQLCKNLPPDTTVASVSFNEISQPM